MRFALVLDFADAVERWFGAATWRWMLGHFVVAAALAALRPGMGLAFYAGHELTQAWANRRFGGWTWNHTAGMLPALLAEALVWALRSQ